MAAAAQQLEKYFPLAGKIFSVNWPRASGTAEENERKRDDRPLLAMTRTSVLVRNSLHNFKQMLLLFNFLRCCRRCSSVAVAAAAGAKRRRRVWQSGTLKFMVH